MKEIDIYELIILEKLDAVDQALEDIPLEDCTKLALKSLLLCRKGDYSKAKGIISNIDEGECDKFSEVVILEAKMLISLKENNSHDWVSEIADQTLSANPRAVYARVIKSQIAFKLGNIKSGTNYITSVGKDYPEAKWIYNVLIGFLGATKHYKSAQKYVGKVEPIFRRILYYILVKILLPRPNARFWISIILILFGAFNSLLSFWFLIFLIPLLVFVFYGIIKKDRFIYAGFLGTAIIIFVLYIIFSVIIILFS